MENFSTIISKANAKDKVIDFRDGLVVALPGDYAMIHGAGGAKHAPVSCIRCTICDYTAGTGDKSVTVSANLDPTTIDLLRRVAGRFAEEPAAFRRGSASAPALPAGSVLLSGESFGQLKDAFAIMAKHAKEKTMSEDEFMQVGKMLQTGLAPMQLPTTTGSAPVGKDYEYSQERVNSYRKGMDGLPANHAPVNRLSITHQSFRDNGDVSRYPWIVKISNGEAEVKESDIGGTSYVGSTFKLISEAFIMLSDADMDRMMVQCSRFIRTFEDTFGIPLVKNGVEERIEQRKRAAERNG